MTSLPTVDVAARIHDQPVALDDPAETFHEASRLAPATIAAQLAGSIRLGADPLLQATTRRASRRHAHRPGIRLRAESPSVPLGDALRLRASGLAAGGISAGRLGTILAAAYGCRPGDAGSRRPVPSAGALYPLEVYPVVRAVEDAAAGVHHFDPYGHRLEQLDADDPSSGLAAALFEPALAELTACALVVTAVFPRTRFKYGQRGYRFALLEAGHLAQNVLLAAAALGQSVLPYGGFYDRRADALVGADGLDECTVYVVLIGGPR